MDENKINFYNKEISFHNKENEISFHFNCKIIENDIRQAYLFSSISNYDDVEKYIKQKYPLLVLNKYIGSKKNNDMTFSDMPELVDDYGEIFIENTYLIAKRIIKPDEYLTDTMLGILLGYPGACELVDRYNMNKYYSYYIKAIIDNYEINLFNDICFKRFDKEHNELVLKIENILNCKVFYEICIIYN